MYALAHVDENELGVVLILFEGNSFEELMKINPPKKGNVYYGTILLSSTDDYWSGEYFGWNISHLRELDNDIHLALKEYNKAVKELYATKIRNRVVKD